ncbi:HEAT repeat domain-containing protein [Streptomyces qaidamensis]|uniref:HEAT repeat domain-containing protein n=1 Tax=Streptomyces qaidamensis TaxID=1783515 RepID=UPI003654F050
MGADHQIAFFLRESAQPDPERRAAALKGLGRIGRAERARVLAGEADDPAPAVRAAAALGLGRLVVPEAGEEALPLLMGDVDPGVRRRASVAATRLGLGGPAVTRAFARLLSDPDHHVRINALDGLSALGVPGDVTTLAALLGDPDPAVWGRARTLLYRCGEDPAVRAEVMRTARRGTGAARARALERLPEGSPSGSSTHCSPGSTTRRPRYGSRPPGACSPWNDNRYRTSWPQPCAPRSIPRSPRDCCGYSEDWATTG